MKIVFRVDASRDIGTGHVMRCITLASWLRDHGAQCHFICREHQGNLIELIRLQRFDFVALPVETSAVWRLDGEEYESWLGGHWQEDASATIVALGGLQPDWLIVDHYAIDKRWERSLRPHCQRLMVVDDLANRRHDCDMLLDQNAIADAETRYADKVPKHCVQMLGPRYAMLQPLYQALHATAQVRSRDVHRVLIYFGGADFDNLTEQSATAIWGLGRQDIAVDVVVDPTHPHFASIEAVVRSYPNFKLHGRLPTLATLMQEADLAIGAGGTTSWERCCLGLPALVVTLAENQKPIAAELDKLGAIRWLGHTGEVDEPALLQALREVVTSDSTSLWSQRALSIVDGLGVSRVGEMLLLCADTLLNARLAQPSDEELLLHWANDPLVRQNSFSQAAISALAHHSWFHQRLASNASRIYILETELKRPVGQVRFELDGNAWAINYTIDASCRNRGLGRKLLSTAITALARDVGPTPVTASVKVDNIASRRVFESLGFVCEAIERTGIHRFRFDELRVE
jgi:UDP-2,4-diacetamido-2,4,6-trideoxy-beta-L-altropyranose hydrolase